MSTFGLDITGILLGLHEDQQAAARSAALRGKPPPPPAPVAGLGGGATGGWDSPPPQPTPQAIPQRPMPQPQAQPPRQGTMLPQSMATQQQGPPAPPAGSIQVDPDTVWEKENADLMKKQAKLLTEYQQSLAPPDMTAAQEAYGKRADRGGSQLLLALAAQHAGDNYKGVQGHFLKQAAEAAEPMKVQGGTLTDTGFIEDPGYRQELKLKQIQAQMAQYQHIIDGNNTRQAKIDAAKEIERLKREGWEYQRGTAVQVANITAGGMGASGPGKADFEGIDATTGTEVIRGKDGRAYRATGQVGADGKPVYEMLPGTSGGNIIPKATYEKNVHDATEAAQAHDNMTTLLARVQANPSAFGLGPSLASAVPGVLGKSKFQTIAGMTPEAKALRSNFAEDAAKEMNRLYGAAQSAGEAARAQQFIIYPQTDDLADVITKLEGGRAYAADARKRWGKAVGQGVTARTGIAPEASAPAALPAKPKFAINPTSGERLQLVNGKWEPVP